MTPAGELSAVPPEDLLRWCESQKFTGTLRFIPSAESFVFPLVAGLVEVQGPDDPLSLALEGFLTAQRGRYELTQSLPPIESSERLHDMHLRGLLGPERVGDLMQFCEATGLTGELRLKHDVRTSSAARQCVARYIRGELASLTLDGRDDLDLATIFAWGDGRWEILALPVFAPDALKPPPVPEETLLRTFEVALADVLEKSAQSRSGTHRKPSLRPAPAEVAVAAPAKLPPGAADTTIKVYFVKAATRPTPPAPLPLTPSLLPPAMETPPATGAGESATGVPLPPSPTLTTSPSGRLTRVEMVLSGITLVGLSLAVWLLAGLLLRS